MLHFPENRTRLAMFRMRQAQQPQSANSEARRSSGGRAGSLARGGTRSTRLHEPQRRAALSRVTLPCSWWAVTENTCDALGSDTARVPARHVGELAGVDAAAVKTGPAVAIYGASVSGLRCGGTLTTRDALVVQRRRVRMRLDAGLRHRRSGGAMSAEWRYCRSQQPCVELSAP